MAVKNLLSQSIFQAKKLKEASAQVVKDSLLSELTTSLKRRIRQSQQDIPEFQDQILDGEQDTFEPQEQEMPVTEEEEILTDQDQEIPPEQQNDEELDDIIQELEQEVPQEVPQESSTAEEDEDLMEKIREILENEQEQIPEEQPVEGQPEDLVNECGEEQEYKKVPQEVIQSFRKKVRELTRQNRKYKKNLQTIRKELVETTCLQLKGKYALNIFNKFNLTKSQKMKIIQNFDRANSEREIKLVYTTLMEGLASTKKTGKTPISRAGASRRISSTRSNIRERRDLTENEENQNSLETIAQIFKRRAGIF